MSDAAGQIMRRIDELGRVSDDLRNLTRVFASPAMVRANALVGKWMRGAGMTVRTDAIGNLIGTYPASTANAKVLLLGSHLDTVRNAGKFDGPLGVLLAIACVEELHQRRIRLPFAIQVVGFADEEGVRYHTAYLGSRAFAGLFDKKDLERKDADGVTMREAIRAFGGDPTRINRDAVNPKNVIGYIEAHIEQGPVLEQEELSVAVVSGIAGQTRARVTFTGAAGHAGTTPMNLRRDALCGAAEFVSFVETLAKKTRGLVATVGEITVLPSTSNVIPAQASISLDVRHLKDAARVSACRALKAKAAAIAEQRNLPCAFEIIQETPSVACSKELSVLLAKSVGRHQKKAPLLPSGAGHDAAIMAKIVPSAMLFIRCKEGISHDPRESSNIGDVRIALNVLNDCISRLAQELR